MINRLAVLGLAILLLLTATVRGGEYGTGVDLDDIQFELDCGIWDQISDADWSDGSSLSEIFTDFLWLFSDETPWDVPGAPISPASPAYEKRDMNVNNGGGNPY